MQIRAFAIGLALACATIGGARATTTEVQFTITGGESASFELSPGSGTDVGALFIFSSVSASVGGQPTTLSPLIFFAAGGFFAGSVFDFFSSDHPFYSGPETFLAGRYTGLVNGYTGKTDTVNVTVTTVSDPPTTVSDPPDPPDPPALGVPEPSTWAMLLLGFLGLGYAGYRNARRRAHETSIPTD